uniref:CELR2 protein n=1 Tax=Anisakis simplex TaxID=6269 RepID=A0A0M3JCP4_ANISI
LPREEGRESEGGMAAPHIWPGFSTGRTNRLQHIAAGAGHHGGVAHPTRGGKLYQRKVAAAGPVGSVQYPTI